MAQRLTSNVTVDYTRCTSRQEMGASRLCSYLSSIMQLCRYFRDKGDLTPKVASRCAVDRSKKGSKLVDPWRTSIVQIDNWCYLRRRSKMSSCLAWFCARLASKSVRPQRNNGLAPHCPSSDPSGTREDSSWHCLFNSSILDFSSAFLFLWNRLSKVHILR